MRVERVAIDLMSSEVGIIRIGSSEVDISGSVVVVGWGRY